MSVYILSLVSSIKPDLKLRDSRSDMGPMSIEILDRWVPAIMFFYGVFLFFILDVMEIPEKIQIRYAELYNQLTLHKAISRFCLFAGGLWMLENLVV